MKKKGTKWLFERNNQLRKLFKIMRLSVILLFIGMHLTFANVGAQSKVTIEHQFVTYQELFTQIQKQRQENTSRICTDGAEGCAGQGFSWN